MKCADVTQPHEPSPIASRVARVSQGGALNTADWSALWAIVSFRLVVIYLPDKKAIADAMPEYSPVQHSDGK